MVATLLNAPFYTGNSRSEQVPGRFDVSLNGRPFMVDRSVGENAFSRAPIPLLRNQADQSSSFGEQTLSPEDAIRRSQESWDHGAGQTYLDRPDADPRRFRASKGLDVWERWALSLLQDTEAKRPSAAPTVLLETVGEFLYSVTTSLAFTTSLDGAWNDVSTPSVPLSIASDGYTVFTAHGAGGVRSSLKGTGATAAYNTLPTTLLAYTRGRLMAANGSSVYNIVSGDVPMALFTHPNVDFRWVGFAEGQSVIYAAGFSGDKSLIYRIGIKQDGSGLDVPIIAGQLPDGEVVRSIGAYLGFVLLGSDKGVRFCSSNSDGSLTIGALVRTSGPVRCFEGQDRFVWFGWSNYDGVSTGLGRLDLQSFIAPLTPAYASDLMVAGQGAVTDVTTFGGVRVLGVGGLGVYGESELKVPTGYLDTGRITYGISDSKVGFFLDVRVRDGVGGHATYLSADGGPFVFLGGRTGRADQDEAFQAGQTPAEAFEVRLELVRDASPALGPVLTRYTLRAYPRPKRGQQFQVPLLLSESVKTRNGDEFFQDPSELLTEILTLQDRRSLVVYQVGKESHTVLVDDTQFVYTTPTKDRSGWNGVCVVRLKALAN